MNSVARCRWLAGLLALVLLTSCSRSLVNSPYARGDEKQNVLYTAFVQRSPKFLDPASSYSTDETPFTYSIYEPLYAYDYLRRPYTLVPRAAVAVAEPVYLDRTGRRLPDDVAGDQV
ncbi:MAG: peptide ABC transporter substrate-binding protein, partial [Burkholderiaceae bacterium]